MWCAGNQEQSGMRARVYLTCCSDGEARAGEQCTCEHFVSLLLAFLHVECSPTLLQNARICTLVMVMVARKTDGMLLVAPGVGVRAGLVAKHASARVGQARNASSIPGYAVSPRNS